MLKEISPEYSLEGLRLKLKLQYFGHLMQRSDSLEKTLMLGKTEVRRKGDNRGRDVWMASLTPWTWVWASSRRWWRSGRPGVLQSVGSQRVRHDWVTEQQHGTEQKSCHAQDSVSQELAEHSRNGSLTFSGASIRKFQMAGSTLHTWALKLYGGIFTDMLETWAEMIQRLRQLYLLIRAPTIDLFLWLEISRVGVPRGNILWEGNQRVTVPKESNKAVWSFII